MPGCALQPCGAMTTTGDTQPPFSAAAVRDAIAYLTALRRSAGRSHARRYLREIGDDILERMKVAHRTDELGFHYNLHGGSVAEYMEMGGIRATVGDTAIQFAYHEAKKAHAVYFFRSSRMSFYDILDQRHQDVPPFIPTRMGNVLIIFRLDSSYLKRAFEDGRASNLCETSIDFDHTGLNHAGIGIPCSTFIADPLMPFTNIKKKLGLSRIFSWLSRDAKTLAAMRFIESATCFGNGV